MTNQEITEFVDKTRTEYTLRFTPYPSLKTKVIHQALDIITSLQSQLAELEKVKESSVGKIEAANLKEAHEQGFLKGYKIGYDIGSERKPQEQTK